MLHTEIQWGRPNVDDVSQTTFSNAFFFNENYCILMKISLKYVRNGPIDNYPTLVQIIAWRRPGEKPLSQPMMDSLLMHICVTRPQWVKRKWICWYSVTVLTDWWSCHEKYHAHGPAICPIEYAHGFVVICFLVVKLSVHLLFIWLISISAKVASLAMGQCDWDSLFTPVQVK